AGELRLHLHNIRFGEPADQIDIVHGKINDHTDVGHPRRKRSYARDRDRKNILAGYRLFDGDDGRVEPFDVTDHQRRAGAAGCFKRFNPAVVAIKQAITGEDILSIAITRVGPFPPRMSNVGVVIDLAVHDIDLIRWFTESEIVEVQPQLSSAVAEREDIALLQFRTASGVLAHINTNWLTPFKARNVTVATRGKYVMGDLLTRQVTEC